MMQRSLTWKTKKGGERIMALDQLNLRCQSDTHELLIKRLTHKPEFKRESKSMNCYVEVIKPRKSKRLPGQRI